MIGIVEETDDETGEVLSLKTVCSSINNHAAELSGPTDTQLTGAWKCELKKKKKNKQTNKLRERFWEPSYVPSIPR